MAFTLFCVACTLLLLLDIALAARTASRLRGWSATEQSYTYIPELPWFSILSSWFPGGVGIILQKEVEWIEPNKQSNILSKTSEPDVPLVAAPNALAEEPQTPIIESSSPSPVDNNNSEEREKQERGGDNNDDDSRRRRAEAIEGDDDWFKDDDEWTNADENFFYADFYYDFYDDEEAMVVSGW